MILFISFQISRDTLSHVRFDVIVIKQVIFVMTSIRSKEVDGSLSGFLGQRAFGVRHDYAAGEVDLCIRTQIADCSLSCPDYRSPGDRQPNPLRIPRL